MDGERLGGEDSDAEAARLRRAQERVRRDLADLAATSAPEVPADVTTRIGAALRAAPALFPRREPAVHSSRQSTPRMHRLQIAGLVAGSAAAALGVGLGTMFLIGTPTPTSATGPTANQITVSRTGADARVPLSGPQIVSLLGRRPDYGPLTDPQRRASCLSGLGYPASTTVLAARPLDMDGRRAVLIVLPGDTAGALTALVVGPNCSSVDTGLLADTVLARP